MSKWIKFIPYPPERDRKMYYYRVAVKQTDVTLGWIKWLRVFRAYSFLPEPETVYEKTCLQDITDFVKSLEEKRKNLIKVRKGIEIETKDELL